MTVQRYRSHVLICLLVALGTIPVSLAQNYRLVKDIKTSVGGYNAGIRDFIGTDSGVFFQMTAVSADDVNLKSQLWFSNGDKNSSKFLINIKPTEEITRIQNMFYTGSLLYFSAAKGYNAPSGLWRSDGTDTGTFQISSPNVGFGATDFVTVNNQVFFIGWTDAKGFELYKTNGFVGGFETFDLNLTNSSPNISSLTVYKDKFYFIANNSTTGNDYQLHEFDLATQTTRVITNKYISGLQKYNPSQLFTTEDKLYFTAWSANQTLSIWSTDGTDSLTLPIKVSDNKAYNMIQDQKIVLYKSNLLFSGSTPNDNAEIFSYNTTSETLTAITDISDFNNAYQPKYLHVSGNTLYFVTYERDSLQIWGSDFTPIGTRTMYSEHNEWMLGDLSHKFCSSNGKFIFSAEDKYANQVLWVTDGSISGTHLIQHSDSTHYTDPRNMSSWNNLVFYSGKHKQFGEQLFVTDGKANGTNLLSQISQYNGSSRPTDLTASGNQLFFVADDGIHGNEVWTSDGTEIGTNIIEDIDKRNYQSSNPRMLTSFRNRVLFVADTDTSTALFLNDGINSVSKLLELPIGTVINEIKSFDDEVLFVTFNGIQKVVYKTTFNPSSIQKIYTTQGETYLNKWFKHKSAYYVVQSKLYKLNENTKSLEIDDNSKNVIGNSFLQIGDILYIFTFFDNSVGAELYKYDLNTKKISLIIDLSPGEISSDIGGLINFKNNLVFKANRGTELWISDGTATGTYRLDDEVINSDRIDTWITDKFIYFSRKNVLGSYNLWRTRGPKETNELIIGADFHYTTSPKYYATDCNDYFYFAMRATTPFLELWRIHSTSTQPELIADYLSGMATENTCCLTCAGNKLFFSAETSNVGSELFVVDMPEIKNSNSLKLYPNPVNDKLTVEVPELIQNQSSPTTINVYNILGEKVLELHVKRINPQIDVSILRHGVYIVQVNEGLSAKFIKL